MCYQHGRGFGLYLSIHLAKRPYSVETLSSHVYSLPKLPSLLSYPVPFALSSSHVINMWVNRLQFGDAGFRLVNSILAFFT